MSNETPVDHSSLPTQFDSLEVEQRWSQRWEEQGTYRYNPNRGRNETYVVDTPPPTVSGSLHVGHVFSYTHADVLVRYQRMLGKNIYYPMGWDDNGLPTERRVQNYFHVRVDVAKAYEPGLTLPAADAATKKQLPRLVSRPNFIELCEQLTAEDEKAFKALWTRVGLSVDWTQEYATIDKRNRLVAQLSFLDLHKKGHVYCAENPTNWDVDFQTAVAQAEVEERPKAGHFHDVAFATETGQSFVISTTRPEMLPACVGVAAHPDDKRFQGLIGKKAITPVFHVPVPIFASPLVDPEKGTGILMVCTFGDATDATWWREQKLALRQIIGRDGRLVPVTFGTPEFPSQEPEKANRAYAALAGKKVEAARTAIVELLGDAANASAKDKGAPLQAPPKPLERAVKFFEKGDKPLEIIATRQWYVRLLNQKPQLLAAADKLQWHPTFMGQRLRQWIEGLAFDWCVSRQRFFGVAIPVWYPLDASGKPDYDKPIIASPEQMPVDPTTDTPPGYKPEQRDQPNGFAGEKDVFDTWFTSSMSPQVCSGWPRDEKRHAQLFPMDLRPQSHEIIRTWTFYTLVKGLLHEGKNPWDHVAISGWILDPDRKKMSKSAGNVVTPMALLDKYTADGVRFWAASAHLGTDTAFDENMLKIGRRLVTKLFNASRFVFGHPGEGKAITHELDRAFIAQLRTVVTQATEAFNRYEAAEALSLTDRFFWAAFTDSYLELVKGRARGEGVSSPEDQASAVATLKLTLSVLVRLFAPMLPFITEEIWSWAFAKQSGHASVHKAPWPTLAELAHVAAPESTRSFELAQTAFRAINKRKSEMEASVGRRVAALAAAVNPTTRAEFTRIAGDVTWAARCQNWKWVEKAEVADGALEVTEMSLAEEPPKGSAPEAAS